MAEFSKRVDVAAGSTGPAEIQMLRVHNPTLPNVDTRDMDELDVASLIRFFRLLDQWDREGRPPC